MPSLTPEDLRQELHYFAENAMRNQLSEFTFFIKDSICDELQHIITNKFHTHHSVPAAGLEVEPSKTKCVTLPRADQVAGTASISLPVEGETEMQPGDLPGQLPGTCVSFCSIVSSNSPVRGAQLSASDANCSPESAQSQAASSVDMVDLPQKGKILESVKSKTSILQTAVNTEPHMARELRSMGYFHRCNGKVLAIVDDRTNLEKAMLKASDNVSHESGQFVEKRRLYMHIDDFDLSVKKSKFSMLLGRIVCSNEFQYGVLLVIIANAIYIGVLTDRTLKDYSASQSSLVTVIDCVFCLIFAIELALRIFVFRRWFFTWETPSGAKNVHLGWNIFDFVIILLQCCEMLLGSIWDLDKYRLGSITVLRVLRIMRVGRLFRLARILRWLKPLRVMATAIFNSFSLFVWSMISLHIITYLTSVYLTELILTYLHNTPDGDEAAALREHFGSLIDSHLSLLKSVSGGIDWGDLARPLRQVDFVFALLPFLSYLFFTWIVLMNIFTGIFLESASEKVNQENEIQLLQNAYAIFKASDHNNNNLIAKEDFKASLSHPQVHSFFSAIKLEVDQAEVLFDLLDVSNDGVVSSDEFLRGCLRLRGSAKAIDLLILSREVNQLITGISQIVEDVGLSVQMSYQMLSDHLGTTQVNQHLLKEILTNSNDPRFL